MNVSATAVHRESQENILYFKNIFSLKILESVAMQRVGHKGDVQ